jgi:Zn ribbon nucleic-acid-binding protein
LIFAGEKVSCAPVIESEARVVRQSIIVPRISSFPEHEAKARQVLRWLVSQDIVAALPTRCGRTTGGMAHALAAGARKVVVYPQRLPFHQPVNGLEVVRQRCIFTPEKDFLAEAGCPECRQEVGEALFASLEQWMPGETDNFICPECAYEDDINGFLFPQPCGFSNLGFIFNNWAEAQLSAAFVDAFAAHLGYPLSVVQV